MRFGSDGIMTEGKMQSPPFKFEWNLNTLAILAGFAGGLIAWGYTVQGWNSTAADLVRTQTEVAALKERQTVLDELKYRITTNEAGDKARDDRMDRFSDVITLLRGSLSDINTKLEVLASKVDTVGEAVKERRTRVDAPAR